MLTSAERSNRRSRARPPGVAVILALHSTRRPSPPDTACHRSCSGWEAYLSRVPVAAATETSAFIW